MTQRRVVVRADAGPQIGGGHVVRCMALLRALEERGWQTLLVGSHDTRKAFEALGGRSMSFAPIVVATGDASEALEVGRVVGAGCDLLIVDTYRWTAAAESASRSWARAIFVIDDLLDRKHDCDIFLNQNLDCRRDEISRQAPAQCLMMIGPEHALLRRDFARARSATLKRRRAETGCRRILVNLGMTDPNNLTGQALRALRLCAPDLAVDVVLGGATPILDAVRAEIADAGGLVSLHIDTPRMAELMSAADLAIGGGGVAAWERCALGLPTLMIAWAVNQESTAEGLAAAGAVRLVTAAEFSNPQHLSDIISELVADRALRATMSGAASDLCDGEGAQRVVTQIDQFLSGKHTHIPSGTA